jgi:predicted PurR-regulated permease PerM
METLKRRLLLTLFILEICGLMAVGIFILYHIKFAAILLSISILLAYVLAPLINIFAHPISVILPHKINWRGQTVRLFSKERIYLTKGFRRIWAIAVVYLILLSLLGLISTYVAPVISSEFLRFLRSLPEMAKQTKEGLANLNAWLIPKLPPGSEVFLAQLVEQVAGSIQSLGDNLLQNTFPMLKKLFSNLAGTLLVPLMTFYILMDTERYRNAFLYLFPKHKREEMSNVLIEIDRVLGHYIRGQIIICICIGISVTVALLLWRIDYAFLIGAFAGIVDIIPYAGVIIGMIPATLLALFKSPLTALLVIITLEVIHWTEGHILVPSIIGRSVHLPPLVVLIALIIGAELMGILGMFLAVPMAAVIRVIINYYLEKRLD